MLHVFAFFKWKIRFESCFEGTLTFVHFFAIQRWFLMHQNEFCTNWAMRNVSRLKFTFSCVLRVLLYRLISAEGRRMPQVQTSYFSTLWALLRYVICAELLKISRKLKRTKKPFKPPQKTYPTFFHIPDPNSHNQKGVSTHFFQYFHIKRNGKLRY